MSGITKRGDIGLEIAIGKFERKILDEIRKIVYETAEIFAATAKALVPVDTGRLRDSVEVRYMNKGLTAHIIVGAEYGIWINYGTGIYAEGGNGRKTEWTYYSARLGRFVTTRGMRAQQFWEPSYERARQHFTKRMNRL